MDAKGIRNMYSIPVFVNKHNIARVASCWFIIYYRLVLHGNSNIKYIITPHLNNPYISYRKYSVSDKPKTCHFCDIFEESTTVSEKVRRKLIGHNLIFVIHIITSWTILLSHKDEVKNIFQSQYSTCFNIRCIPFFVRRADIVLQLSLFQIQSCHLLKYMKINSAWDNKTCTLLYIYIQQYEGSSNVPEIYYF